VRRVPRFPVKLPARLLPSAGGSLAITIVDISRDGLGIELPVPVETDQPIGIECGSVLVLAIVRHCRQLPDGIYRAGAEMHHLLERNVEIPANTPRLSFLERARGRRYLKGTGAPSPRLAPRLL
jgi:hypothetical protein